MPIALPLLLFPALTNSNQANNKRGFLICLLIHVTVSEQLDNPYTTALDLQVGKMGILIPNVYQYFCIDVLDTTRFYFSYTPPILVR